MPSDKVKAVGITNKGMVREHNEDWIYHNADLGLVIVADGMGGHNAGEVASRMATEVVRSYLIPSQESVDGDVLEATLQLGQSIEQANKALGAASKFRKELSGMGTTMVVGVFRFGRFFYAHVGDSRIYQSRDKNLKQLTRDHSLVQELVDNGLFETLEDAEAAGIGNNVLTRGLGLSPDMEADVAEEIVQENDIYLFCTDGLTNMVNDDEIADFLSDIDQNGFEQTAQSMLNLALDRGAYDNVSFVLARPIFKVN